MANSEISTTFIPPLAKYPERMFFGIDGTNYGFDGISDATNFDEYLSNYIRPYAEHLAQVDGISNVRLPMSWVVWEHDYTTGSYGSVSVNVNRSYKDRLGKILEVLADANLSVTPVLWSNKTNLSGYFYPLSTMAKCAFEGIDFEACVDRGLFEWLDGQDGQDTDGIFDTQGYTYWTGSSITISSNVNWGGTNPSSGNIATVDPSGPVGYDNISGSPYISSIFTSSIDLPADIPAQFLINCKNGDTSTVSHLYDFQISTLGPSATTYYWDGKEWTTTITSLRRNITGEDRQFVSVWFETMQLSASSNYELKIAPVGSTTEEQIMINSIELYLCGSEADVRNYFSPRNVNDDGFDTPSQMITSRHGFKGQNALVDEIIPPFESSRIAVRLPNPGMYRVNNYEEFFSSTYEDVLSAVTPTTDVSNLDINGAVKYIDDILATIKAVETSHNLVVEALDVFEHPFSVNRPLFSNRESICVSNFIRRTIEEVKNNSNYTNSPLMISGTSPEVFEAEEYIEAPTSTPDVRPFAWMRHRLHPVTTNPQWGMDTGSALAEYNVYFPSSDTASPLVTYFDLGEYQTIDFTDSANKSTEYNLSMWDQVNSEYLVVDNSTGYSIEDTYHINTIWGDTILDSISRVALFCGYSPDYNSHTTLTYPMSNVHSVLTSTKWFNTATTVSVTDAGSLNTEDEYFGKTFWKFSDHWNSFYSTTGTGPAAEEGFYVTDDTTGVGTNQSYIPIHLPEPIEAGFFSYDPNRRSVVYSGKSFVVDGDIVKGETEYLSFASYSLVTGGARVYPAKTIIPLQFNANRSFYYGGVDSSETIFDSDLSNKIETRSIVDVKGNTLDLVWAAEDHTTAAEYQGISGSFDITIFDYENVEGSLGTVFNDSTYAVEVKEGTSRIFKGESTIPLEQRTSNDWDHIWAMLPDFWTSHFEDTDAISGMWAGTADIASNMLANLYQYDLSKGIHTAPFKVIGSNEAYPFSDSTYLTASDYTFSSGSTTASNYMTADSVQSIPVFKNTIGGNDIAFRENEDYEIKDGSIFFKDGLLSTTSTTVLFAPWISYNESIIYQNFGHFLDLKKPESEQYRDAVLAGLYGLWNGHTLNVFKLICDALAGFPIVPYRGKVKFVNVTTTTFSLVVEDQFGNERSIELPANFVPTTERPIIVRTGLKTQVQITNLRDLVGVEMFSLAPATNAFEVYDRKTEPQRIESLARILKDKRIGMYNTTVGELDAANIDKIGDLYESLEWGSREEMFTDILKLIELVRGQYHIFQLLIAQRPIEEVLIKESEVNLDISLDLEPTFDHNMFNYMHSGSDWALASRQSNSSSVAPVLGITQEGAERPRFNPDEGRSQGQKYKELPIGTPIEADENVYASLGGDKLKDGSRSGWTIGFDKIKKAASRIFKFKPSYSSADQDKHGAGWVDYLFTARDSKNLGKEDLVSWESSSSDQSLFAHVNGSGNGEWTSTMMGDTGTASQNQHFEYPQKDDDVADLQIRSLVGKGTDTVSISTGVTVMSRVKPKSKGVILELSGDVNYGGGPPPPIVGACCKPVGNVCTPCTPPITNSTALDGCAESYTCVDNVSSVECSSIGGIWQGVGTTCTASACSVVTTKCCSPGKHCNQPPGHCNTTHQCDMYYAEYCACVGGETFPGEDCSPTYDCVGVNAGPCCSEQDPPEGEIGIDPIAIDENVLWDPDEGGIFTNGSLYKTDITLTNNSIIPVNGYLVLSDTTDPNIEIDPNSPGYSPDPFGTGKPGVAFELPFAGLTHDLSLSFSPVESVSVYTGSLIGVGMDGLESSADYHLVPSSLSIDIDNSGAVASFTTDVATLDFGVPFLSDGSVTASVTVTNTGTVPLTGTIAAISPSSSITLTSPVTPSFTIATGGNQEFIFTLDPTVSGVGPLVNETIDITSNATFTQIPIVGEVLADQLIGTINGGNNIVIGNIDEDTVSDVTPFDITNNPSSNISGSLTIKLTDTSGVDYSGSEFQLLDSLNNPVSVINVTLAPNETYTPKIEFNPSLVNEDTTFNLKVDVGNSNFSGGSVFISATTIDVSPYMEVPGFAPDFGNVDTGSSKTITGTGVCIVKNYGVDDLTVTLPVDAVGDFSVFFEGGSSVAVLSQNQEISVHGTFVSVDPIGPKSADILIQHDGNNDPNTGLKGSNAPYTLHLVANSTDAPEGSIISYPSPMSYADFAASSPDGFLYTDGVTVTHSYSSTLTFRNDSNTTSVDVQGTIVITDVESEFSLSGSSTVDLTDFGDETVRDILFSTTIPYEFTGPTSATLDLTGETSSVSGVTVSEFVEMSMSVYPVWDGVFSMHGGDFSVYTTEELEPPVADGSSQKGTRNILDSLDFGTTIFGDGNPTKTFTVKNVGGGVINGTVDHGVNSYFTVQSGGTFSLENGETSSVTLVYTVLDETNIVNEDIFITTTGGEPNYSTATINCSGQSEAKAINMFIDSPGLDFGAEDPGSSTTSLSFNIQNAGTSNKDLLVTASMSVSDAAFSVTAPASWTSMKTITPSSSLKFTVEFDPLNFSPGSPTNHVGQISLVHNATNTGSPEEFDIIATTNQDFYSLTLNPTSVDVGNAPVDQQVFELNAFTITNIGNITASIVLEQTPPFQMKKSGPGLITSFDVGPSAAQTVDALFSPTDLGEITEFRSVTSVAADPDILLTGTGVAAGALQGSGDSSDLGWGDNNSVFNPGDDRVITLENSGTSFLQGSLTITASSLGVGNTIGDWSILDVAGGTSSPAYSLTSMQTVSKTINLDVSASSGQWVYLIDSNMVLGSNTILPYFRPHVLRSLTTSPYVNSVVPETYSASNGIHTYKNGVDEKGATKSLVEDAGSVYIRFQMKNDGVTSSTTTISGFDFNSAVFGDIYDSLGNKPDLSTTLSNFSITGDGVSKDMFVKVTCPAQYGVYSGVLMFDETAEPYVIDLQVQKKEPEQSSVNTDVCNCCIGKGTPYVYCDDSLTIAQCYALGGTPNDPDCETNGSMGSIPN